MPFGKYNFDMHVRKLQYLSLMLSQEHTVENSIVVLNFQGTVGSSVSAAAQTHQELLFLPRRGMSLLSRGMTDMADSCDALCCWFLAIPVHLIVLSYLAKLNK